MKTPRNFVGLVEKKVITKVYSSVIFNDEFIGDLEPHLQDD